MIKVELTMGERFKDARLEKNQHGKQLINEVSAATNVSASLISDLENDKDRRVNYKDIVTLANHYGVTTDYLLNGSPLYSKDIRVNSIAKYTGLSVNAVELLHIISESDNSESMQTISFLNLALSDPRNIPEKDWFPVTTFFSYLYKYLSPEESFENSERLREFISVFDLEADPKVFYKEARIKQIQHFLDYLQTIKEEDKKI